MRRRPGAASARTARCARTHAGLRLEEHEREVVDAEAGEQPRRLGRVEPLRRDALRGHRALGLGLPAVLALREPRHAALDDQLLAALGLQLAPQRPRPARGRACSRRRRRASSGSAATRRPSVARAVARLELVDERDLARPRGRASRPATRRRSRRRRSRSCMPPHAYPCAMLAALSPPPRARRAGRRCRRASRRAAPCRGGGSWRCAPARADAPVRVLVSGSIHGTEPAGHAVIARLRRMRPARRRAGVDGAHVNPDGVARGTRQNARGVDLNRNFPSPLARRRAARSTPTTRGRGRPPSRRRAALMRLIRRIRPAALDPLPPGACGCVNLTSGADPARPRLRAAASACPARPLPVLPRHRDELAEPHARAATAFVVELPAGALTPRSGSSATRAPCSAPPRR